MNSPEFGGTPDFAGTLNVNSANTSFDNYGSLEIYNSLSVNSSSAQFRNFCSVKVLKNIDFNTSIPIENNGYIEVQNKSSWNTTTIILSPSSNYKTSVLESNSATIQNLETGCSKLEVTSIIGFFNNTFNGGNEVYVFLHRIVVLEIHLQMGPLKIVHVL